MTRMIPSTIHSSVRSGAERRMFKVIEKAPNSDHWVCLHSLSLARHDTKRRGEIDFVLLCQHGVFVFEVKGGGVKREEGVWYFTDRYGDRHKRPEGPFDQASSAMFSLEKSVKGEFAHTAISEVMFGYGVIMPDVRFEEVGCEADSALVYDVRDRKTGFDRYVNRLVDFTRSVQPKERKGLNKDQISHLASFLRVDFDLVPSVSVVLDDTCEQLTMLTREQYSVIDALDSHKRLVVEGAAGSGKTLLAIEVSKRMARRGMNVLLICYNNVLAKVLSRAVSSEATSGKIEVRTLHSLCHRLIDSSSLREEFIAESERCTEQHIYDVMYPEYAALAVCEDCHEKYDVLVVDESQDILTGVVLEVLDGVVRGGLESGVWQIYLDANVQSSIYGRLDYEAYGNLRNMAVCPVLTVNCRNTKPIADNTAIVSCAERRAVARAEGPPVEFCVYTQQEGWLGKLTDSLRQLDAESVPTSRIVVLVPKIPSPATVAKFTQLSMIKLGKDNVGRLGAEENGPIYWSLVSGFKGLESDVVVLVGVDNIDGQWWRAVTYVGMSRARVRLIVLIDERCETRRMARLEAELEKSIDESEADL